MPEHSCYVEPFCGGLNMLLRKKKSTIEIVNDLDGDVINFFRVLRERPQDLIDQIKMTPYSRLELLMCRELPDDADPLEKARALYVRAWMGFSGPQAQGNPGWRFDRPPYKDAECLKLFYDTDHLFLIADRLKQVEFECNDALVILKNFDMPDTLFYVDPPYYQEHLKEGDKSYQHEMGEAEHRALAEMLHTRKGMVMLSGYNSPFYEELYGDFTLYQKRTTTDHNKHVVECLWLNDAAVKRAPKQSLFDLMVGVECEEEDDLLEEGVTEEEHVIEQPIKTAVLEMEVKLEMEVEAATADSGATPTLF